MHVDKVKVKRPPFKPFVKQQKMATVDLTIYADQLTLKEVLAIRNSRKSKEVNNFSIAQKEYHTNLHK